MSAIGTLNNGGYYQLSNPQAGVGGGTASNSTNALLQALGVSPGNPSATSPADAYLLDLSPQAQALVNGTGSINAVNPTSSSSSSFVLSSQQQQAIANILQKYKDSPYTQATFDQIQNDLQAAGLDPQTLSRKDQAQSFNATALFIADLNGDGSAANAITNPNESQKASNYVQQIISEWKQISGNTGSSPDTSSAVTGTSGTGAS
jgi:hypothetical protein